MEPNLKSGCYDGSYRAGSFIGSSATTKDKLLQDIYASSLKKKHELLHKQRKVEVGNNNSSLVMFPSYVKLLQSEQTRYQGLYNIRRLTEACESGSDSPILQSIIDAQIIPMLLDYLTSPMPENIKIESSWIIINISAGKAEYSKQLFDGQIFTLYANLLSKGDTSAKIKANLLWGLSNLVLNSAAERDKALENAILSFAQTSLISPGLEAVSSQMIYHILSVDPVPPFSYFAEYVQYMLTAALASDTKIEVTENLLLALKEITIMPSYEGQHFLSDKIITSLLTKMKNPVLQETVLKIFGNLIAKESYNITCVLCSGFLNVFEGLMDSYDAKIRDEICWTFSNLMVNNENCTSVQYIFKSSSIIPKAISMKGLSPKQTIDIVWGISNLLKYSTQSQIAQLGEDTLLKFLSDKFSVISGKEIIVIEALKRLLDLYHDKCDIIIDKIKVYGLETKIGKLIMECKDPETNEEAEEIMAMIEKRSDCIE